MNHPNLADQAHRSQALDITQSFSVQAPAGSGKTELLSLRYLKTTQRKRATRRSSCHHVYA